MENKKEEIINEVIRIIKWAEYEGHIQGDVDILISNIKEMDWPR